MPKQAFGDLTNSWEQLAAAVASNPLPMLAEERSELEALVAEVRGLSIRQDAERAASQTTTKEIAAKLERGREIARRLRATLVGFYGPKAEKLVEFGVKPQRPRKRSVPRTETPAT